MNNQACFKEQIIEAVLAFVSAQTWNESKQIVKARRNELLTDAADQVFATLLEQYKDDVNATRLLQEYRTLLARCRREGIEAAFADHLRLQEMPDIPPELMARLSELRSEEKLRELLEEHSELLSGLQQVTTQLQTPQRAPVSGELGPLIEELQSLTHLSDMPHRIELCQAALKLVDRDSQSELWADLQGQLANSLSQSPLGKQADNLEQAIQHYQQALEALVSVH